MERLSINHLEMKMNKLTLSQALAAIKGMSAADQAKLRAALTPPVPPAPSLRAAIEQVRAAATTTVTVATDHAAKLRALLTPKAVR